MDKSKAAAAKAAIQKRFGNSTIAKQAALAATKALTSSAVKGKGKDAEQCVDPLYKKATARLGQQKSERGKSAGTAEHRAAPGALEVVAKPSMQPFLTQRKELQLDDNKSYRMQKEDGLFDEQLFTGHVNSSATPHGHSEAPCTEMVHGGDSRFGARSPGHVRSAQMISAGPAGSPDSKSCKQKQRSPSLAKRKEEVQRLKAEGASHALPPCRPHSPLPEDRHAMQCLVQSMSRACTPDHQQALDSTIGASLEQPCDFPASAAPPRSPSPASGSNVQGQGTDPSHAATRSSPANEEHSINLDCEEQHSVCATALDSPQRTLSPERSAVQPGGNRPALRPLSPLGKVIKSVPVEFRHSAPPDMSKVQARYLDIPDPESRSREESPNRRAAHERHYWWRLGQMHADVPDYKSSQARLYENDHCLGTGSPQAVVSLKQVAWSFDGTHPALAGEHCMRTREQNEALEKERLTAQQRLDESRRIVDDQQRRAPARRAQLAAAARASADSAHSQGASPSGQDLPNHQPRPRSAGPASRSTLQSTAAAVSSSRVDQDEALQRLQLQSNAITQRAQAVLNRSEQLGQTFDAPMNAEIEASAQLRPQTAPTVRSEPPAEFATASAGHERPMMPQSSTPRVVNAGDDLCSHTVVSNRQCLQAEALATESGTRSIVHGAESAADQYRDEAVATGAYSDARYADYSQDLNLDMQLRYTAGVQAEDVEGGYESDLERDTLQLRQTAAADSASMLIQSFEHEAAAEQGAHAFRNDNCWMDEYRKDVVTRCRSEGMPEAGYFDEAVETGFQSPEPITTDLLDSATPVEAALLQQRLIPEDVGLVANEAIFRAERVTAARARARAREGYHSDDAFVNKKNFAPARSKTFGFEKRAKSRPKPIAQVKMEQDLEMKRREGEKETTNRVKANKVPRTSSKKSDGLFYKKQLQQSVAAKERIEYRKQELSEMLSSGAAFSFCEKDLERREEKARRLEAHRNNKNRFQVTFKAKEVPAHVKESRLVEMLEKQQQRKEIAREEAHKKLNSVNEQFTKKQGRVANAMAAAMQPFVGTVEDNIMYAKAPNSKSVHPLILAAAKAVGLHDTIMQLPKKYKTLLQEQGQALGYHELNNAELNLLGLARKNFEVRAKHATLRHTDALWNKYSGKKPVGAVPDFDVLHAQWETRLSTARQQLRQRTLTQPKDFSFNSGTPKEMAEREAREAERHQKVVLDKMLDEEELTELRWPFRGCRGKVHPTEPPVFLPVAYHETKASQLRRKHMQHCKEHGQYELRSVKQERTRVAAKQELQRRAKAHVAKEQADARRRILQDLQTGNTDANQGRQEGGAESPISKGTSVSGEGDVTKATPEVAEGEDVTRDRLTEAHRQSRHNKIETDVTNMTRELLATAGLDVLRFVEGPQHPTQSAKQILEAIVASVPRNRAEVGKQLASNDDQVLKACLREIGQEWNTTGSGGKARKNAIGRLKNHVWNFMR